MKKHLIVTMGIVMVSVLSGCGSSGAPSCSDNDVKNLLQQIIQDRVKDDYAKYYGLRASAGALNYDMLKREVDSGTEWLKDVLDMVDRDSSQAKISISNIRTQGKDDELSKSECAASVNIVKKNPITEEVMPLDINLTYSAQYSDDGSQVYVEAYGL